MASKAPKPDWHRQPSDSPEGIQAMLNALPAMVGYWDSDQRNRMANDAYIEYFGRTPREMRGMHLRDLLGPELYAKNLPYVEGALAGEPQLFDRAITTPSGEVRYTQASYIPDVIEGKSVRGFFVLVTDITERRGIEEEVEHSRARLAEAERVARMGSWEWDIPGNQLVCSEGLFAIYGIRAEDFDGHYEGGSQWVHPEDRALVERVMREAVDLGTPVDYEFRIIRPDGRVRRIHSRAELIADAAGNPVRLTGTVQDVTEVRAAAEALHETATDIGRRAAELLADRSRQGDADLTKLISPRQLEILSLVAEGLSNSEIASRLYLTESTVKWHVRKILKALGVANRAQAVARYLGRSIYDP